MLLAVLCGLPLDPAQLALFRACTGRMSPLVNAVREAWLVIGRRGGKSLVAAFVAVYWATFADWTEHLARGERATMP